MNKLGYCTFFSYCSYKDDMCHSPLPYKKCWNYNTFINKLYKLHKDEIIEYFEKYTEE